MKCQENRSEMLIY